MGILEIWIERLSDKIAERIVMDERLHNLLHILGDHVAWATEDERVAFHNAVNSLSEESQENPTQENAESGTAAPAETAIPVVETPTTEGEGENPTSPAGNDGSGGGQSE